MTQLITGMLVTFALVLTRMAAFVAVSPFPGSWVPARARIALAILLAVVVAPHLGPSRLEVGLGLVSPAAGEITVGVVIGFVMRLALVSADMLGAALAQSLGLTFAASYDPQTASQSDPLSHLVTMVASLAAIATGAHRVVLGALLASVEAMPPGHVPEAGAFLIPLVDWLARSVEHGLGLAVPVVAVCLVVQLAVAFVSRAAPQLQVFSVGMSITIGSGLLVLFASLGDVTSSLVAHLGSLGGALERVLSVRT